MAMPDEQPPSAGRCVGAARGQPAAVLREETTLSRKAVWWIYAGCAVLLIAAALLAFLDDRTAQRIRTVLLIIANLGLLVAIIGHNFSRAREK